MLALFKAVVKPESRGPATLKPKMFNLGGTSCIFKKSIAPFARYEISSRVLCWDQKWIYVVSHFTKPGSHKATHSILTSSESATAKIEHIENKEDRIYATAITKYVFKQGRITIAPETILQECGLLPSRPMTEGLNGLLNGMGSIDKDSNKHLTWIQVQQECDKHLPLAQNFGSLDQLHGTFVGRGGPKLYSY